MYLLNIGLKPPIRVEIVIEPVSTGDLKKLTKKDFFFDWKELESSEFWKLRLVNDTAILGVMSLTYHTLEDRIEINLIASRRDNVGPTKQYERIAGCLIGWACRLAVKKYGFMACVSLRPKSKLIEHYQKAYGMLSAGPQLYLEGKPLYTLIQKYIDHEY